MSSYTLLAVLQSRMPGYGPSASQTVARIAYSSNILKTHIHLIKLGKMSLEDIAEATELPLDVVRELEVEVMQLA